MTRHLNTSTNGQHPDGTDVAQTTLAADNGARGFGAAERPNLKLVQTRLWSHTLIVKGHLDGRAAAELEDELECLRQEGVTALTLDLRQLDGIEAPGAQVIAFQSVLFEGRGGHFAVQASSPTIRRALYEAGADLGAPPAPELAVRRVSAVPLESVSPDLSTTMTREFGLA